MKSILVLFVVLMVDARSADACTCIESSAACDAIEGTRAVFTGTVIEIKKGAGSTVATTLQVHEVFRGTLGKTVVVHSEDNGAACGYHFEKGARMLVYAHGKELVVSLCSRTRPEIDAPDDLAYLRTLRSQSRAVEGRVVLGDAPRAHVEVRARGTSHATRTAADGTYRLPLPRGKYMIELVETDPRVTPSRSWSVELIKPAVCERVDFRGRWNGRIRGRLVDHRGRPARNVLVHAHDTRYTLPTVYTNRDGLDSDYGPTARTDATGTYEIGPLAEGSYRVAVSVPFDASAPIPETYYPGVATSDQATLVRVVKGRLVPEVDFRLPAPVAAHKLTIFVRGRVLNDPGARVYVSSSPTRPALDEYVEGGPLTIVDVARTSATIRACAGMAGDGTCTKPVVIVFDRDRELSLRLPN